MSRFPGSTSTHEAMNERMRLVMGDQAEGRMHQLMGARFSGCAGPASTAGSYGPMMGGGGMMGGSYRNDSPGSMMSSVSYTHLTLPTTPYV